jgi:hypothetical protein
LPLGGAAHEQDTMKKIAFTFLAIVASWLSVHGTVLADPASPFKDLPGRWVGDGRLGFKEGKFETVKCRATYFLSDDGVELKQNIRCASASGNVEVKSEIKHAGDQLSGKWNELIYNVGGDLSGQVTPAGFRITVRGEGLTANMEVIVREGKQIIEIQFFSETLVGLTLVLTKDG